MTAFRRLAIMGLVLLAAGCASKPRFETAGIDKSITPQTAVSDTSVAQGREVLWGGVIVNSSNLADSTQIEILAYPLDDRQRPDTDRGPIGRFIATRPGYLETADYATGRLVTVRGKLEDKVVGRIGDASYTYPVVRFEDSQLWQREASAVSSQPRVNFGIGVMIGR